MFWNQRWKFEFVKFGLSENHTKSCAVFLMLWTLQKNTGCNSIFRKIFKLKIWKEPMLVQKQTIHQQKALDLSFNLTPWKWACHYHEAARPSRPPKLFFTPRGPMLFLVRGRGALLIMPHPLSGCQIKAEIQGFLLMYRLFLY